MRLTRRRAIELAGAATAVAALRPATADAASFTAEVPLPAGARASGSWRTLAPVRAPGRFDLIGLDFGRASHVHAQLRARAAGGRWTPWAPVHAPTQPVWTGPADEFQVRFSGAARRLQARFVRTGPAPRAGARASGRARQPEITPRSGWGGHRLPPKAPPDYGVVQMAFVHHTVTANEYDPEDSPGIVLGICRYHRDHNGWNDIGYNFLVDKYGQIFEGRAGGMDLAVLGAQAQGYNSHSTGVSCLGDYTSQRLPDDAVEGIARLLAWKLAVHGVPPRGRVTVTSEGGSANRYRAGSRVTFERISGHRDGNATACPGEELYAQLDDIRRRAAQLGGSVNSITLRADETDLVYPDQSVALAGSLRFADDSYPGEAPIQILYRARDAVDWTPLTTALTGADGAFAAEVSVPSSGRLRADFDGDTARPAVLGTPIAITVRPAVTLRLDPKPVVTGDPVAIHGTVEPAYVLSARLVVHRRRGPRARVVMRRDVQVVNGFVEETFVPRRRGLYRVTLRAGGTRVRRHVRAV